MHELKQRDPENEMHHAIVVTPRDTVLYLTFDTQDFGGKRLKGEAIWEWNPDTGEDVKRWRSWDFMDPALDRSARTAGEWLHGNSLYVGPGGNILLSFHYINQVISIAPDWNRSSGGSAACAARSPCPPDQQTSAQHTAAELEPNRILMFDNRTALQPPYSRAVEYVITRLRPGLRRGKRRDRKAGLAVEGAEQQLRVGGQLGAAARQRQHADRVRDGEGPQRIERPDRSLRSGARRLDQMAPRRRGRDDAVPRRADQFVRTVIVFPGATPRCQIAMRLPPAGTITCTSTRDTPAGTPKWTGMSFCAS